MKLFEKSIRVLELPRLLEMLEHHAVSAEAKARARRLTPSDDFGVGQPPARRDGRGAQDDHSCAAALPLAACATWAKRSPAPSAEVCSTRGSFSTSRGFSRMCAACRIIIRRTRRGRSSTSSSSPCTRTAFWRRRSRPRSSTKTRSPTRPRPSSRKFAATSARRRPRAARSCSASFRPRATGTFCRTR